MTATHKCSSIIFDLDGTLIDSAPGIISSFRKILHQAGISPTVTLDHSIIGPPLYKTLALLTGSSDSALLDTLAADFRNHYDHLGALETRLFQGVSTLLEGLIEAGITLHICTNKRQSPSAKILRNLGLDSNFVSLYALDMEQNRYNDKTSLLSGQIKDLALDPTTTVYVGDTHADGTASYANGIPFYYAAWGYGNASRKDAPIHWFWVDSPENLSNALSNRLQRPEK
jgi:phosphoglycolate phosphatase